MDFIQDPVLSLSFSTLLFLLWWATSAILFPRRYSIPVTALIMLGSIVLYFSAAFMSVFGFMRLLFGSGAVFLSHQLTFRGRWYQKLLVTALELGSMLVSELIMLVILPNDIYFHTADIRWMTSAYILYTFCNIIFLALIAVVGRMLMRRYNSTVISKTTLLFFLFPASQYVACSGWFTPTTTDLLIQRPGLMLAAVLLFLAADAGLVYALSRSARSAALQARNALLEEQVAAERNYYSELAANYEDIRRMRHDIDNHLYTIQSLLADGQSEAAARYADGLRNADLFSARTLTGCENTVVASFLLHKQDDLEKQNCHIHFSVSLSRWPGIQDLDLICALGNLLDNAAEACAGIPDAEILLEVRKSAPYLCLHVSNPVLPGAAEKSRRIPELQRGVGQTILQKLAEEYDGHFDVRSEDGRYEATLFLKAKEDTLSC